MTKPLSVAYEPTSPPIEFQDWHRWIDDELHRIRNDLQAPPIALAIEGSGTIGVDDVPTTITLAIGDLPVFDVPGGSWNTLTGEYTVTLSGLYSATVQAFVDAFGTGNKNYQCSLQVFVNENPRSLQTAGGADDVPLAISITAPLILFAGDILRVELTTLHEQFTGSTGYSYSMSILREGSSS